MIDLTGKIVEVGTADIVYTGKLVEIGESEVLLESDSGWVSVPMARIAYIREKENGELT